MRPPRKLQRLLLLGLLGPIVALNVWLVSQVYRYFEHLITVLVAAAILAFLLNYSVQFFERARISRAQAVTIVLIVTATVLGILGVTLVPLFLNQTVQLLNKIPAWLEASQQNLQLLDGWAKARNLPLDLQGIGSRISGQIESEINTLAKQALGLALGTLTWIIDGILILVLAFYMLLYGDRLWIGVVNLLPPHVGIPLSESLRLNFHNFFISQFLLAVFMTVALIPIFLVQQVPFALLFATLIGIAELIPFIGAALGIGGVALLLLLQNPGLALQMTIAAVILQQIRDNVLAPRMMGNFTGLNPIWIFIALLMGLQIAGFLGILVAVPVAGTIKGTLDAVRGTSASPIVTADMLAKDQTPPEEF
jgi:predicted PurR-regulated permease PerM